MRLLPAAFVIFWSGVASARADCGALLEKIKSAAASLPAQVQVNVAVKLLEGGEPCEWNGDRPAQMASVFKIPIAVEAFRQAQAGRLGLNRRVILSHPERYPGSGVLQLMQPGLQPTLLDLIHLMLVVSDNEATDVLLERVGIENVNRTLEAAGLKTTRIRLPTRELILQALGLTDSHHRALNRAQILKLPPETWKSEAVAQARRAYLTDEPNVTTAQEMNLLLETIFRAEILRRDSADRLLEILAQQQFNQRLPRLLPPGTRVAHKTGSLTAPHRVVNDAGIVHLPGDRHVAISVFINHLEAPSVEGEEAIARIGRAVYDYFQPAVK